MAPKGGVFDHRDELLETLQQAPGEAARQELGTSEAAGPPPRWSLRTIRASLPWLHDYSLSGVWRLLRACKLRWRGAQVHYYSPDPEYASKLEHLLDCLGEAATQPAVVELLFIDEMGFYRWPDTANSWSATAPAAAPTAWRGGGNNQQWRIIGAVNAYSGQTTYLDNYIAGRKQLIAFYRKLVAAYPKATKIYVVQDNWSVHAHPEVLEALAQWPQIEIVWLPTYAPWLNPIEKLWRWLRQAVLRMHRLAADWPVLRKRVQGFLDQFARGSQELLHYIGLLGKGKLAQAINPS